MYIFFQVLYSLISFGISMDPNETSPLDPPNHLFRIRLACVLLETCGMYLNSKKIFMYKVICCLSNLQNIVSSVVKFVSFAKYQVLRNNMTLELYCLRNEKPIYYKCVNGIYRFCY